MQNNKKGRPFSLSDTDRSCQASRVMDKAPHQGLTQERNISRSLKVNIDQIQELQPTFKGENLVVLKNGKSYPTTRPLREIQQKLEFR